MGGGHRRRRCDCECKKRREKSLKQRALHELATHPFQYRDEAVNNVDHPEWGQANLPLLRAAPPQYADGISSPGGVDRPNARHISNTIFNQVQSSPSKKRASALFWLWGQFLDHDLGLTEAGHDPVEPFNISVPAGDPVFDPEGAGDQILAMDRSIWDPASGTSVENPRQQINQVTSYIDASNIYGDTSSRLDWMKYEKHGLLKTSAGNMLPYNDGTMANAMSKSSAFYVSGDVRANEHLGLTAMHTLWVREHNYWALKMHKHHPELSDHELFQRARVMVEAEMQAITLNEFLPVLLGGKEVFGEYTGYDPTANPQMRNEFTTAAYRLGHTLVSTPFPRLQENGDHIHAPSIQLRDAFFVPHRLTNEGGIDPIFRGLATVVAEEFDGKIVDDLRNFLFGGNGPHGIGLDLSAFNIQRGRDHGLADYNTTRAAYGLPRISSFSEVVSDPVTVAKLEELYGSPDNADLYVVLQVEDHVTLPTGASSMLGPTTMAILGEQATRIRAGDRFWYQLRLPKYLLKYVEQVTLNDVIRRNTDICWLQEHCMIAEPRHRHEHGKKK